jgi:uncharacterized protein (TIGR02646 family)
LPEEGIVYFAKQDLRGELLTEQGSLCCYCQQRIFNNTKTVIEHLLPKGVSKYAHLTFEYDNLLACCNGKERKDTPSVQPAFCGHKKADFEIDVTPLQADCEQHFTYGLLADDKVEIVPFSTEARKTVETLGLIVEKLQNLPGKVLKASIYVNGQNGEMLDVESMKTLIMQYGRGLGTKPNQQFREFCLVEIAVLKSLIGS